MQVLLIFILGQQYSTCSIVINVVAAAVWVVGSQTDWDPTVHGVAAIAFITLLHVKYFLPLETMMVVCRFGLYSFQGSNLKGRVPFRFEGLVDSEPFNADMQK